MKRIYLIGFEFDNLWKRYDVYSRVKNGILIAADEWSEAMSFTDREKAESKCKWLQENFSGYTWCLVEH